MGGGRTDPCAYACPRRARCARARAARGRRKSAPTHRAARAAGRERDVRLCGRGRLRPPSGDDAADQAAAAAAAAVEAALCERREPPPRLVHTRGGRKPPWPHRPRAGTGRWASRAGRGPAASLWRGDGSRDAVSRGSAVRWRRRSCRQAAARRGKGSLASSSCSRSASIVELACLARPSPGHCLGAMPRGSEHRLEYL
eukprot:scaffold2804_cov371-Prasinococcus_capsulatus_cf.AAC.13